MAIKFIQSFKEYVGLSTDDKTAITQDGAVIYYTDTKKRYICNSGLWTEYTLNTDVVLATSDLEIGAVEIKNATSDDRMKVNADGSLDVKVLDLPDITIETNPQEVLQSTHDNLNANANLQVNNSDNAVGNPAFAQLTAGAAHIGKFGFTLKKISTNFTRPNNTDTYAQFDAITTSTSAPAIFELDLASIGAVAGQAVEIRKVAVVSSAKQTLLPLVNAYLSPTTFTATNDNAELSIDDTTMETGGCWLECDTQNRTALNSRVAKSNLNEPMILAAADTKLYGTLQVNNNYVPVASEKFTIIIWVALL